MQKPNMLAVGFIAFAAFMLMLVGSFQAINGLAAIFEDNIYLAPGDYILEFDVTVWGWIHLILGIVVAVAGLMLLRGATWARIVAIAAAALSAIANFTFIPYYPVWSIIIIAVNIAVIWALTAHGRELAG